ncbi:hypothetical protein [Streptomyces sp. NPDC048825]|uniref:hypothetical protein n=1 Tax=Streptomyces sp. NPDC048825 TaxID=3365592 RepID=UPI003716B14C
MTSAISRAAVRLTALLPTRADLTDMRRAPRRDLLAGLTVAIVALPLGFGVSSGLGGSNFQVSGPTGAMTVVRVNLIEVRGPSARCVTTGRRAQP